MSNLTANSNASVEKTSATSDFVDRRSEKEARAKSAFASSERRQFGNSYNELSESGRELAIAIDQYKVQHRRRYITPDEMISIVHRLGYKQD